MTNTGAAETGKDLTPPSFVLWYRASGGRDPWEIVARAPDLRGVVALIGIGGRPRGDWMPLVAGKHPNKCGAPDRPLRKPVALAAAATATPSLWGAEA